MESVRADHVGPCYGYHRETAPNICELAEDGVQFNNAYAQGSATPVSMPTFLTSRSPRQVGMEFFDKRLSDEVDTFPEIFRDKGYETQLYSDHHSLFEVGFYQGMQAKEKMRKVEPPSKENRKVFNFYFFLQRAHAPYIPAEEYRLWDDFEENETELRELWNEKDYFQDDEWEQGEATRQEFINLYNGEIRHGDDKVGRIIDDLKEEEVYDDALIVYWSDHGQRFGEYEEEVMGEDGGMAQHTGPPDPIVTHVPLIIKFPDNEYAGKEIEEPVRLVDVAPTILGYTDLMNDFGTVGKSLIPLLEGKDLDLTVFSADRPHTLWSIIEEDGSYFLENVEDTCKKGFEAEDRVYNRIHSPSDNFTEEKVETVKEDLLREESLREMLCGIYLAGGDKLYNTEPAMPEEETVERLEDLGYLE